MRMGEEKIPRKCYTQKMREETKKFKVERI
jgi:hypothetical protein